ncbi:hypothetical protein ACFW9F_05840 [Streptomyces sp. NPDC059506]|uniref:hypothetical protein n=1 Tax=Streptomyces TaxID=1883 RepID=UPI003693B94D
MPSSLLRTAHAGYGESAGSTRTFEVAESADRAKWAWLPRRWVGISSGQSSPCA